MTKRPLAERSAGFFYCADTTRANHRGDTGMATARIDAEVASRAADGRRAHHEAERIKAREAWFERTLKTPVTVGHLWWKSERYRTQSEAEALYDTYLNEYSLYTPKDRTERRHTDRIDRAVGLRDLALASLAHGDSLVILNLDDIEFLELAGEAQ